MLCYDQKSCDESKLTFRFISWFVSKNNNTHCVIFPLFLFCYYYFTLFLFVHVICISSLLTILISSSSIILSFGCYNKSSRIDSLYWRQHSHHHSYSFISTRPRLILGDDRFFDIWVYFFTLSYRSWKIYKNYLISLHYSPFFPFHFFPLSSSFSFPFTFTAPWVLPTPAVALDPEV